MCRSHDSVAMTVGLLLCFCLSLWSQSCYAVATDANTAFRNLRVVENGIEEVIIGFDLVNSEDPERYKIHCQGTARRRPMEEKIIYLPGYENTSAISLGYLKLCYNYSIKVEANFSLGALEAVIDLKRPCPIEDEEFKPRNLRVVEAKESSVSLSWDEPERIIGSNEVQYAIIFIDTKTNVTKRLNRRGSYNIRETKNVSVSDMLPCSKYYVEIVAIYKDFKTSLSQKIETPALGPRSPNFTTEVTSHDTVKLFIVPSVDGCPDTSYIVSATGKSMWDETYEEIAQFTTTKRNLTLTGLYPGTEYKFQVAYQNENETNTNEATTLDFEPTAPLNVEAFRASSETVRVKWSPPEKSYGTIKNYWVEIYNDDVSSLFRASPNVNQLSVHSFTSKDYSSDMGALVWVENQRFNSTKSLKVLLQRVPKITKDPYDYS